MERKKIKRRLLFWPPLQLMQAENFTAVEARMRDRSIAFVEYLGFLA